MSIEKGSYLKELLNADISNKENTITYTFQRARLKLNNQLEIQPLLENEPAIKKTIEVTEDEVCITFSIPDKYQRFYQIQSKTDKEKWLFSYQLLKKIRNYSSKRFIPVVSPENIVFDAGYTPYLLHYGVKDSLVPSEHDETRLLLELKATICTVIEGKHQFEEYVKFSDTLKLTEEAKQIIKLNTFDELLQYAEQQIRSIETKEKSVVKIPKKNWKIQRYLLIGFIVCFIPLFSYMMYSIFFMIPKQEAFISGSEAFLERNYSEVITLLEDYDPETMPYVVLYQLASSYVASESLTEEQRKNVTNSLTLHAEKQFFYYWIYIGRGMSDRALTIARTFGDQDLIVFALINYEDEIKQDNKIKAEEKQELLDEITMELDEFMRMKEQEERDMEQSGE